MVPVPCNPMLFSFSKGDMGVKYPTKQIQLQGGMRFDRYNITDAIRSVPVDRPVPVDGADEDAGLQGLWRVTGGRVNDSSLPIKTK